VKEQQQLLSRSSTSSLREPTMPSLGELKSFLEEREGASLSAWLGHFGGRGGTRISLPEFLEGARALSGWGALPTQEAVAFFEALDADGSGDLSPQEVDRAQAAHWRKFRHWAAATYESGGEMAWRLGCQDADARLAPAQFAAAVARDGWAGGCEELLFASLDIRRQGALCARSFRWFDAEKQRLLVKVRAQRQAALERDRRSQHLQAARSGLEEFKQLLRRRYGSLLRAWRCLLSPDDSTVLQRPQFFRACVKVGRQDDARLLWHALDSDESGEVTLDELDPHGAEVLASFRVFVLKRFGGVEAAFRAIDKDGTKTVCLDEFVEAMKAFGFDRPSRSKLIFHGLDKNGMDRLTEENMAFIERWRPLPFLLAHPNAKAAEEFKTLLLKRFGSFLKSWRQVLDKDNSNECNWKEFVAACERVRFSGDVPGAWRALDKDLSGCISLNELDPVSNAALMSFKHWAEQEFGGVRAAFSVFDADGSREITSAEFRKCCKIFGFRGDTRSLFRALDVEGGGTLTPLELFFLDEWDHDEVEAASPEIRFPEAPVRGGGAASPESGQRSVRPVGAAGRGPEVPLAEGRLGSPADVPALATAVRQPPGAAALKPGLAAWQSRRNPWHLPRRGPLPSMTATVDALLGGKPPLLEPVPIKKAPAQATVIEAARRPLPAVPGPLLHMLPPQSA